MVLHKKNISILLATLLFLSFAFYSRAADLTLSLTAHPGNTVEVGQEVYFTTEGTTYTPDQAMVQKGRYEWDFDDGYTLKYIMPTGSVPKLRNDSPSGPNQVHYFMKPGTYHVTVQANLWATYNTAGDPLPITSVSTTEKTIPHGPVTTMFVEPGKPFEVDQHIFFTSVENPSCFFGTNTSPGVVSYNSTTGEMVTNTMYSTCIGSTYNNWTVSAIPLTSPINGTVTTTITVTGKEPLTGFEVQRASFANRTKQYLYVQIPAAYRGNTTQMKISLIGETTGTSVLTTKAGNLVAEEKYLLTLPTAADSYVLQTELLDAGGSRIVSGTQEGVWRDFFTRDGTTASVTIDENNVIHKDGEITFPVQGYMLDWGWLPFYFAKNYVNGAHSWGYDSPKTPTKWENWLNQYRVISPTASSIGPGSGDYSNGYKKAHLMSRFAEFVLAGKDKPALLGITTQDEPNMGGATQKVYSPTIHAWEYVSNLNDMSHPFAQNYVFGDWYSAVTNNIISDFDYQGSQHLQGGKKWVPQLFGYDLYPYAIRNIALADTATKSPVATYFDISEGVRAWNGPTSLINNRDYRVEKPLVPFLPAAKTGSLCVWGILHEAINATDTITMATSTPLTFHIETGLRLHAGMQTYINRMGSSTYLFTHVMRGTITSYDANTGVLVFTASSMVGSGTYSNWQINVESPYQPDGEIYSISWLETIHGAKGLLYFVNFSQQTNKWDELLRFSTNMEALKTKLLTPVPARTITRTDKADAQLDRVDTMIREVDGIVYVVAARVTEPEPLKSECKVVLSGVPSTVITNGKIRDVNNRIWDLEPTVTIGNDGAATAWAVSESYGKILAAVNTLTTIETPTAGWTSVTNTVINARNGSIYTGIEPETITPTFEISGLSGVNTISVYDESGRTISSTDGAFQDTFDKYAVHIYQVTAGEPTPDTTPPELNAIVLGADGASWTFTYSEPVVGSPTSDLCGGYTTAMTTAGAISLTYVSGSGTNTIVCSGTPIVYTGDTVANGGVDYTQPGNGIEDASGNDLASLANKAVTNNSTQIEASTPPILYDLFPTANIEYFHTNVELSVSTSVTSTCRYHATSVVWSEMTEMDTTGGTIHLQTVDIVEGANSFKVVCQDEDTEESEPGTWAFTKNAATTYILSITPGEGVGVITSLPEGLVCGATCEYAFDENADVVLSATCLPGYYGASYNLGIGEPTVYRDGKIRVNKDLNVSASCVNGRKATLGAGAGNVHLGTGAGNVHLGE